MYDPALPRRPSIVIANKMDAGAAAVEGVARLRAATSLPVIEASALHRTNVGAAVAALRWLLEAQERMGAPGM